MGDFSSPDFENLAQHSCPPFEYFAPRIIKLKIWHTFNWEAQIDIIFCHDDICDQFDSMETPSLPKIPESFSYFEDFESIGGPRVPKHSNFNFKIMILLLRMLLNSMRKISLWLWMHPHKENLKSDFLFRNTSNINIDEGEASTLHQILVGTWV